MTTHFSLEPHGIRVKTIYRNLSPAALYEHALEHDAGTAITDSGALVARSTRG
jgi:phosphoenolpyruvate carboxykinase (ATP)